MSCDCLKFRRKTENIIPRVLRTKSDKTILSKCEIYDSEKSRFMKNQEARGVLGNLGLKTPLNEITLFRVSYFKII